MPIKEFLLDYIKNDIDNQIFDEDIVLNDHEVSREIEVEELKDMNFEDESDSEEGENLFGNYDSNQDKTPPFKTPNNLSTIFKNDSLYKNDDDLTPPNIRSSRVENGFREGIEEGHNKSDEKEASNESFDS